jgi:hypothetical protein
MEKMISEEEKNVDIPRLPSGSPSRRSITTTAVPNSEGAGSRFHSQETTSELLSSVEFVPPIEGTPAALALAGIVY